MFAYPARLFAKDNGYSVAFADFPDLKAAGKNPHEAVRNASMALTRHLESFVAKGQAVPPPGILDAELRRPKGESLAQLLIPADYVGRVVRLNISMDESVLNMSDRQSAQLGMTRSGYIAHLIRSDRDRLMRAATQAETKPDPKAKPARKPAAKAKGKAKKR
ncbi:MAG: type II toxin-antitoxin system HicB family antitoxin [Telmatospirillum sp.]|nr:type II toxin-antitoxin system HicB family antitoxin [Telmatospirillum sp.]